MRQILRTCCAMGVIVTGLFGCSSRSFQKAEIYDSTFPEPSVPLIAATERVPQRVQSFGVMPVREVRPSPDLRVMSFNIRVSIFIDALNHWSLRKSLLVETIRNFNPDLLGTQEALASQSDYLRSQLPEYDFVGVGRNDGGRRGEMCGIFYKRDRFNKLEEGHFWLSDTPERPGSKSWGTAAPRMVTWVKLRDRVDGNVLCFLNTHFDHRGKRARAESAKLLRLKLREIAGSLPVIITGDFNADEDSVPYRTLIGGVQSGAQQFVDTFRAVNGNSLATSDGTRHGFGGGTRGPRIDWIVTNRSFRTVDATIDRTRAGGRYPSDHFPVTAVVRPVAPLPVARVE